MNHGVARVFAAERIVRRRRRSTFFLPAAAFVLSAVLTLGVETGARNNWFGVPSGFFVVGSTLGWLANALVLLAVVTTAFLVSREFALGTAKSAWVRPLGRQAWFGGKVLYSCAVQAVVYAGIAVAVAGLAALRPGFTDLMEKDYLVHTAGAMGGRMVLVWALVLYTICAATVVTAAFAVRINHPGGTIAAVIGFGMALATLSVFPAVRPFLLTTYVGLPAEQMVAMSKGLPLPLEWNTLVWRTLAAGTAWAGAAYAAGRAIVAKKEILS